MKMILMRSAFLSGVILTSFTAFPGPATASPQTVSGATPIQWSVRLADSVIAERGDSPAYKPGGRARWDYSVGLFTLALLKLDAVTNVPRYVAYTTNVIGSFITTDGGIRTYQRKAYELDSLNSGKTLLALWQLTGEKRYQEAATLLRRQLDTQPRTPDGGFWHKERYTNQMWLDGIYMAEPFYAEYAKVFGETNDFNDVAKQFRLIDEHTYDPKTGLNYHGWDAAKVQPWANPVTGCSSNFWGRAEGWYAMALVDTLDYFPTNLPARSRILATFRKTCAGIVKWQDPKTGLWWQVLDQGGRKGNYLEATASAMFVYALAKGVNRGYLPQADAAVAEKGYDGIVRNLIKPDDVGDEVTSRSAEHSSRRALQSSGDRKWSLTHCCAVAGLGFKDAAGRPRDGSFAYYVSEPVVKNDLKGVGPFILAGIELHQLENRQ